MGRLLISFEKQNLQLENGEWLFRRREKMRFEWLALLALRRLNVAEDQGWVTLGDINRLPSWGGKSRHHVATNIGRYLQSAEIGRRDLVTADKIWGGPYRLNVGTLEITFDISVTEARRRLQLRKQLTSITNAKRMTLLRFTLSYARARWLLFRGRLRQGQMTTAGDSAYQRLMSMVADRGHNSTLRLLACLSAVEVLYRLGRIRIARQTLLRYSPILRSVPDLSLKAWFQLELAWAHQRSSSGRRSDRAVENCLSKASAYAQKSGDRAALGLLAFRTGGYLTKKGAHLEAVNQLLLALEAYLITGNYDAVQSSCGNIGSILHRLGPKYYPEARQWLLLSIAIARWMKLGRDDAHAEMILGKIYVERNDPHDRYRSWWLLERAERIAERAGNPVNLADVRMVRGFWHQRFGTKKQQIETLMSALRTFRSLTEFDVRQKEKYMQRSFPEVWDYVAGSAD